MTEETASIVAPVIVKLFTFALTSLTCYFVNNYYKKEARKTRLELAKRLLTVSLMRDPDPSLWYEGRWEGKENEDEITQKVIDSGLKWHDDIESDMPVINLSKSLKFLNIVKKFHLIVYAIIVFTIPF